MTEVKIYLPKVLAAGGPDFCSAVAAAWKGAHLLAALIEKTN
jgi:hypothetical protein